MPPAHDKSLFIPLMGLLFVLAWLSLWMWDISPYGRYLQHGQWSLTSSGGMIQHAGSADDTIVTALLYVSGWVLMTAAMMLPTTLPLLEAYRRLTLRHSRRGMLMLLVVSGYIAAWLLFGLVAHSLDHALHRVIGHDTWLGMNSWVIAVLIFTLAGLFQFSSLKYRCLDKCRSPLGFVISYWGKPNRRYQAWRLGIDHGIYCVGCCWALMLLMFVMGTGNIGWMLLLGAAMAAEKNLPIGNRLSTPLGGILFACAVIVVLYNTGLLNGWGQIT